MNDDANNETERKLRELGKRLRNGLRSRHSDISANVKAVHDAIIQQTANETGKSFKELKEQVKKQRSLEGVAYEPQPDEKHEHEEKSNREES
jgi:hypothetical protein